VAGEPFSTLLHRQHRLSVKRRIDVSAWFFGGSGDPAIAYEASATCRLVRVHNRWVVDKAHSVWQSGE